MPARGPAGDDDRPLDAVLAGLCVEPVERAFQLVGDLRQGRLRRQRVAAQSRRPTASQRTLGEAGKDLLAAALPIAAVNVNEAWVPLIAFSVSISQVEMLRALLAQRLRSCGPAFGFLARVLGAHVLDIVVCEIAGLERHCNPVHGRALFCAKGSWCRDASSGRRHEGTTVKRCHFNLPDFLELGSDRAKCKALRAGTGNATTLAEYRKAPCNYLNDKEAGQGPRFVSISSERHGCIPVSFHWQMPDMREHSATLHGCSDSSQFDTLQSDPAGEM